MKNIVVFIALLSLLIGGCSKEPRPIDYGNEVCSYCSMTIVDKIHGAELVTDKGKIYVFDAMSCMLRYISDNKDIKIETLLTNYYENPSAFIYAKDGRYLISKNLSSPMGANLTAFKGEEILDELKLNKGGETYTWETIKLHMDN